MTQVKPVDNLPNEVNPINDQSNVQTNLKANSNLNDKKDTTKSKVDQSSLQKSQAQKPVEEKKEDPNSFHNRCRPKVKKFLEHWIPASFMFMVTIWALFGDDIRQIATDKNGDGVFYDITTICMGFFCIEILLTVYADLEYFNSFFFWLDIMSTAT